MHEFDVFFYGLNMDRGHLANQGVAPRGFRIAYVEDHAVKLGAKAMLIPARGCRAFGAVFKLTHGEMTKLYGHLSEYVAAPVLAMTTRGEKIAALSMIHRAPPIGSEESPEYARQWRALVATLGMPHQEGLSNSHHVECRSMETYRGACHCGNVRFAIETDFPELTMCDCSICRRKNALMVKVHESRFRLVAGEESLKEYQFHTKTARHHFCAVCGIYTFHRKRVTPDNLGINVFCLEDFDPTGIPIRQAIGAAMT